MMSSNIQGGIILRTIYNTKSFFRHPRCVFAGPCFILLQHFLEHLDGTLRHWPFVFKNFFPSASFAHKTTCSGEDALPFLPRLHCPSHETLPFPYSLNMVQDRDGGVACQYEIAVHTVNKKGGIAVGWRGRWNGFLGGDEAVSNYSTTKNTPGVRRMPDLAKRVSLRA